jgi:cytochrome c oxidase subunit II
MADTNIGNPRRVLIVSSHPLFGQGLRNLLLERKEADVEVVGIVTSVDEAVSAYKSSGADLVIVDYDDERVNRDEFLTRFVEGEQRLRLVLLSLKEGGSEAIVYDRRSLEASQIDDWLKEWNYQKSPSIRRFARSRDKARAQTPAAENAKKKRFSLNALLDLDREPNRRRSNMKHLFFAGLLVIGLTALMLLFFNNVSLLPIAASLQAEPIDQLFQLHYVIISFLFSLIVGIMLYSVIVFRRRPGDDSDGEYIEGSTNLEVIWTIVPLAVVIYVSYLGALALGAVERPDPRPLEISVVASQWSWRFEYPEWDVTSNELVLPVNQQTRFSMISTDVIHSFWVPEFRVKQDILPGGENMVRELRVTPNREGDYSLVCAEMCGQFHANMEAPVRVVSQAEFEAWIEEQAALVPDDPVERGQLWARQYGCLACHTTDGPTLVGPTWQGLFMHEVLLEDGSVVIADEAYLYESIVDPSAKIVAGFPNIMPDLSEQLTEEQVQEIIEFIKSLE